MKHEPPPRATKNGLLMDATMMLLWLVGQGHPSEKYEFVNWDDYKPNINGKMPKMATKPPTSTGLSTAPSNHEIIAASLRLRAQPPVRSWTESGPPWATPEACLLWALHIKVLWVTYIALTWKMAMLCWLLTLLTIIYLYHFIPRFKGCHVDLVGHV